MTMRRFGALMMIAGGLFVLVGVFGYLRSDPSETAAVATTTPAPPIVTSAPATTVTTAPATTTTTLAPATTTTTVVLEEAETLEEFVLLFSAALDAGDVEFVWRRLHPDVVEVGGEALCRSWVENEIMGLSEYTLFEVTAGPATVSGIDGVYSAAVSFVFQGERFDDAVGQFALVDGTFRWLGVCR